MRQPNRDGRPRNEDDDDAPVVPPGRRTRTQGIVARSSGDPEPLEEPSDAPAGEPVEDGGTFLVAHDVEDAAEVADPDQVKRTETLP